MTKKLAILTLLAFFVTTRLTAQTLVERFAETNGKVNTILTTGDTIIIGGSFSRVYSADSSGKYGSLLTGITGKVIPRWPRPDTTVHIAIPDGKNGYFIGGDFQHVGDSERTRIAHIDSNGIVTSDFSDFGAGGDVYAMALQNDTLYVGGNFNNIGSSISSSKAVAFDKNRLLKKGFPKITGVVRVIIPDGSGGWYVGGDFTKVGIQTAIRVTRLDSMGNVFPVIAAPNGPVTCMAYWGDTLFIGGNFTSLGGLNRSYFAAIDMNSGVALALDWKLDGIVSAIAVSGDTIYLGGKFTKLGTITRNYFASINIRTGILTSLNPSPNNFVNCIVAKQNSIYVGGEFFSIAGSSTNTYLGVIDAVTGALIWNPAVNSSVNALTLTEKSLYIAGRINSVSSVTRNNIACVDLQTRNVTTWAPVVDNSVTAMVVRGGSLIISGSFLQAGGQARSYLAELDTATGLSTGWNPAPNNAPTCLAISGENLCIGGTFSQIGGIRKNNLFSIALKTGQLTNFDPNPDGFIMNLCVTTDSTLYACGNFTHAYDSTRNKQAIFNFRNNRLTAFNLPLTGEIYNAFRSDTNLFVGGLFSNLGGATRNNIASINLKTGLVTSWNPNPNGAVYAITVADSFIYFGGAFTIVGSSSMNYLCRVKVNSNIPISTPSFNLDKPVWSLASVGNTIYVGGDFTFAGPSAKSRTNLAAFDKQTGVLLDWNPSAYGRIESIANAGNNVYVGGTHTGINSILRNNIAAIRLSTGTITGWNPGANALVQGLALSGRKLYAIGDFTMFGGKTRNKIGSIFLSDTIANNWSPAVNDNIWAITVLGNKLYIGGQFTQAGGAARNRLAALDTITGNALLWNPGADNTVYALAVKGNTLFVGGDYWNISGQATRYLTALDTSIGGIKWTSNISGGVRTIVFKDSILYAGGVIGKIVSLRISDGMNMNLPTPTLDLTVLGCGYSQNKIVVGGNFGYMNGIARANFGAFNDTTGDPSPWKVTANGMTKSIKATKDFIYVGGEFNAISDKSRNYFAVFSQNTQFTFAPPQNLCLGSVLNVPFNVSIDRDSGNVFVVQLSDSSGKFDKPVQLGSLKGVKSDTVQITIPVVMKYSSLYRMRVVSTDPYLTTADSSVLLALRPNVGFTVNNANQCLYQNSFQFVDTSVISVGGISRKWSFGPDLNDTSISSSPTKSYGFVGNYIVKLTCTSDKGCIDSLTKTVIVHPNPVVGFNINAKEQCMLSNQFTFTDTSSISSGSFSRNWTIGGLKDTAAISVKSFQLPDTLIAKLVLTSNRGCKDSIEQQFIVNEKPTVLFNVNQIDQCINKNQFEFKDSSYLIKGGNHTRLWTIGYDTTSVQNPVRHYNDTGSISVKLKVTSNKGCSDSVLKIIKVHALPRAHFIINLDTQCLNGNRFVLTDSSVSTIGVSKYLWNFGGGLSDTGSATNSVKTYTVAGKYSIQLIVKSLENCIDSNMQQVVVKEFPSFKTGFTVNDATQCEKGNHFEFLDTTILPTGTFTRKWLSEESDTTSLVNYVRSYKVPGFHEVSLMITDQYQCSDTALVSVNVFPSPLAEFFVNDSSQCLGGNQFLFTDSSRVESGTLTRTWRFGSTDGDTSILLTPPPKSYSTSGVYQVKLLASTDKNCKDSAVHTIQVFASPSAKRINGDSIVSELTAVLYSIPQTLGSVYSWYISNGSQVSGANSDNIQVLWGNGDSLGRIAAIETNVNGCSGDSMVKDVVIVKTDSILLSRDTLHFPATLSSDSLLVLSNRTWSVSSSPSWLTTSTLQDSGTKVLYLTADFNSGPPRDTTLFFTAGSHFRVVVVMQDGISGIKEELENKGVVIYPNPSVGIFQVQNFWKRDYTGIISDIQGRSVDVFDINARTTKRLNYSELQSGIYFIRLTSQEYNYILKLVIQR